MPNDTRWNSYYHAMAKIKQVIEQHPEEVVQEVFLALDVVQLRDNEITFVKEYCDVMQPVASALDILQAENKCFIGFLLPTLTSLKCKLSAVKHCVTLTLPLVDALLDGLATRFAGYSEREDLIIASLTLPQFRLRWLDDDRKGHARTLLYQYVSSVEQQSEREAQSCSVSGSPSPSLEDDFFSFDAQPADTVDTRAEVDVYLTDTARDIPSLHRFPRVKALFLKFNTALPSSAPVERLFSLGGQILTPRRNRLTPGHFERQLLLRANKWLLDR